MEGGRDRNDSRHAVRNWSVASLCSSLSVFPLGMAAAFLDFMGAWKYLPGPTAVTDIFFVICVLPPVAGVICGRVALKKIAARPEMAGNFKRIAMAGKLIGYILAIPWVLYVALLLIVDIFEIGIHFH